MFTIPRALQHIAWCTVSWLAAFTAADAADAPLPRDQLRHIVQQQCLPHWQAAQAPSPCERVTTSVDPRFDSGYAVLHDRKGGVHYLLIPTASVRGIEDPVLLSSDAPNYFALAWRARDILNSATGQELPRGVIGFAVNHLVARSQDQLHIHMSCLRPDLVERLRTDASHLEERWLQWRFEERDYFIQLVGSGSLEGADPFKRLHDLLEQESALPGSHTLLVAGLDAADGPGFALIAGTNVPGAERLLDSDCAASH